MVPFDPPEVRAHAGFAAGGPGPRFSRGDASPWVSAARSWSPSAYRRPSPPSGGPRPRPPECRCRRCCGGRWRAHGLGRPPAVEVERERTRQVSRIGNNLNQIARWANTRKRAAEAVEIVARLVAIERALRSLAPVESPDADAR